MKKGSIILLFFLAFQWAIAQNMSSRFEHLTMEDGLSQSSVTCIIKDSQGFMWFGTEDGLNRYDGTSFTVYRHLPKDSTSLSSSYINTLVEHEDGFLWVGTKNGLNYFNPYTETFTRYLHHPNDIHSLSNNSVIALSINTDGSLLVGTMNGLNFFDRDGGFKKYYPEEPKGNSVIWSIVAEGKNHFWVLSSKSLEKVKLEDGLFVPVLKKPLNNPFWANMVLDSSALWIGSGRGLLKYNPQTSELHPTTFYDKNSTLPSVSGVLSLINGTKNTLYIGTRNKGLVLFDRLDHSFKALPHNPYNATGLNSSSIRSVYQDAEGILWIGTYGGGVNKYDPRQPRFNHYKHILGNNNTLSENTVRSILLDKKNRLWVGTHGGLNLMNREAEEVTLFTHDSKDELSISSNTVRSICEDPAGIIWAGTWLNGLNKYDEKTKKFESFYRLPGQTDSINQVRALAAGPDHNLWIGSYGLWRFNTATKVSKKFLFEFDNGRPLLANSINILFFDKKGLLWIGTKDGLNCMDTATGIIKRYLPDPEDPKGLSHKYITSIAEDKKGRFWIGTYGGGLNQMDVTTGTFKHYNTQNGLLNDVIYGVLVDDTDRIWFTSNAGLGVFDQASKKFRHFDVHQGLQDNEFNAGAYFESVAGEFFFGGINGFNAFDPLAFGQRTKSAPMVFTEFQLLDEESNHMAPNFLETHISRIDTIQLRHDQNNMTFSFAELSYADLTNSQYEYQLIGLSEDWNPLGKEQKITLGNLASGNYVLNVKTTDDLTKKASVALIISPPFWKSTTAYGIYLVAVGVLGLFLYRHFTHLRQTRQQFESKIHVLQTDLAKNQNNPNTLPIKRLKFPAEHQRIIQRALQIVEEHLSDSSFDISSFAANMNMSRSQLYRKLTAYTGCSPTKFIRLIRLKKAAQLLNLGVGSVAEVAFKVGFENVGYFSKCFNETFGVPPSQYKS